MVISTFVPVYELKTGSRDFNADGDINISDVIALLKFIRVNPGNLSADFDQNGKVNLFDVLTMLTHLKSGNCSDSK